MAKHAMGITPVTLTLDRGASRPLDVQVAAGLRTAILSQKLRASMRLPSSRALAEHLRVSRNTVVAAFEQLVSEGYVESRVGSGTHVISSVGKTHPHAHAHPKISAPRTPNALPLSRRGARIAAIPLRIAPYQGALIPFHACTPSVTDFPMALWGRLLARRWRGGSVSTLDYGDPQGCAELRNAVADYARATRGVTCEAEQVFIVTSTQQAIDFTARMMLDSGDKVWVEDPGYHGARNALSAAGARLVSVPVDEEGINVAWGERREPRARLAYVTPSHQFPLGVTMSLQRRMALLDWARRAQAFILEDDYDSEFQYVHRPLPALQGMDTHGRVIYVGTFSKLLFPSVRLGYMILPHELVHAFCAIRNVTDGYSATLNQLVLADFLCEGHFERHVRKMRNLYRERQEALLNALKKHLAGVLDEVKHRNGGMHLTAWLPPGMDDRKAAKLAAVQGVDVLPLSPFATHCPPRGAFLLGYSSFSPKQIDEGARRLARVLAGMMRRR